MLRSTSTGDLVSWIGLAALMLATGVSGPRDTSHNKTKEGDPGDTSSDKKTQPQMPKKNPETLNPKPPPNP